MTQNTGLFYSDVYKHYNLLQPQKSCKTQFSCHMLSVSVSKAQTVERKNAFIHWITTFKKPGWQCFNRGHHTESRIVLLKGYTFRMVAKTHWMFKFTLVTVVCLVAMFRHSFFQVDWWVGLLCRLWMSWWDWPDGLTNQLWQMSQWGNEAFSPIRVLQVQSFQSFISL